jgi:hypothetical protein
MDINYIKRQIQLFINNRNRNQESRRDSLYRIGSHLDMLPEDCVSADSLTLDQQLLIVAASKLVIKGFSVDFNGVKTPFQDLPLKAKLSIAESQDFFDKLDAATSYEERQEICDTHPANKL